MFNKGDQVFAVSGLGFGTYAEYKCMSEEGLVALKPKNMSYAEASTIPVGGIEALYFMREAKIKFFLRRFFPEISPNPVM